MKKTLISLCAVALAAPLAVASAPAVAQNGGFSIQFGTGPTYDRDYRYSDWEARQMRREARRQARSAYYNGYRGYAERRPGYVYRDGWWFPAAAFALGAIVGGATADAPRYAPRVRAGSAHVEWCYDRWKSYRASDNTYQPNSGPRRQCVSPYS